MVAKDTSKIKSIAQKIAMVPSVGICFDPIAEWQRQYERELRSSLDEVFGAPGRTRTDTGRILSPLSLPLDYGGHEQVLRQFT